MPGKHKFLTKHLFLQVRDELASRVATGAWKAGSMLPNENQLSAELQVSLGTVRKALDILESEKIVTRQQGRGTFVVDHDTEEMAIRFSSIFNRHGQKVDGHIECEQNWTQSADEQHRAHLHVVGTDQVVRSIRTHFYHDHPFMVEQSSLAVRHFRGLDGAGLKYRHLSTLAQKHGVHLAYATEKVSAVLCPEDKAEALGTTAATPVLCLERTVYTDHDVSVEWRRAWCHLTDKYYMSVTS